jgi:hypothetical protein
MVTVVENAELAKGIRVLESLARSGVDDDSEEAQRKRSVEDALRRETEDQRRAYLERKAQEEGRQELSQVGVPLPPAPLIYDTPTAWAGAVVVGAHGVVSVVGAGAAVVLGRTAEEEASGGPRFADERQSAFDPEEFVDRDPDSD